MDRTNAIIGAFYIALAVLVFTSDWNWFIGTWTGLVGINFYLLPITIGVTGPNPKFDKHK